MYILCECIHIANMDTYHVSRIALRMHPTTDHTTTSFLSPYITLALIRRWLSRGIISHVALVILCYTAQKVSQVSAAEEES